ncbi:hypothetical protein OROMI_017000 [Orobanche minor]
MGGRKTKGKGKRIAFSPLAILNAPCSTSGILANPPLIEVDKSNIDVFENQSSHEDEFSSLGFVSDVREENIGIIPPAPVLARKVIDRLPSSSTSMKHPASVNEIISKQQLPAPGPAPKSVKESTVLKPNPNQQVISKATGFGTEKKHTKADFDPSYAELVRNNRNPESGHKLSLEPALEECIRISKDEVLDIESCFGHALVGYFPTRHPGKIKLKELCDSWKVQHDIIHNVNGWITFIFKTRGDRDMVYCGGPYSAGGHTLLLKELPEWFKFGEDGIRSAPVWVILPNLPLECWSAKILSRIASRVGTPLLTDKLTKTMQRIAYARVLVDVDVSKELLKFVEIIDTRGISFQQKIEYEFVPRFCHACNRIGHSTELCKSKEGNSNAICKAMTNAREVDCPPAARDSSPFLPASPPAPAVSPVVHKSSSPKASPTLGDNSAMCHPSLKANASKSVGVRPETSCQESDSAPCEPAFNNAAARSALTGPAQINSSDPFPADGDTASCASSDPENDGSPHDSVASDETEYAKFETVGKKNRIIELQVGPRNLRGATLSSVIFRDRKAQERAQDQRKGKESGLRAKNKWK